MKVLFVILLILLPSCKGTTAEPLPPVNMRPELHIYCENGIVGPILEISRYFEVQYRCDVRIHNGNVGALIGSIIFSGEGDVFIPDSYAGMEKLLEEKPEAVQESIFIGNQQMVFVVPKDNPESFDGKISSLADKRYAVLLSNPVTSSLGIQTAILLGDEDGYRNTMTNVLTFSADSRGLIRSVARGEANVAIDWLSSYLYNSNRFYVDTLQINEAEVNPEVHAGVLRVTEQPGLAYTFLAVLSSPFATEVFERYGIVKPRDIRPF
jgi:ABC-type molybdate transport system substrate-binding protein